MRRRWAVILLLGAVAVPSACGAQPSEPSKAPAPAPKHSTPKHSDPDPTRSGSPSPTVRAGAESPRAAITAYVEAMNRAIRNGDTTPMLALSTRTCQGCKLAVDWIADLEGATFEGDPTWTLEFRSKAKGSDPAIVQVTLSNGDYSYTKKGATKPVPVQAADTPYQFELVENDGEWRIQHYFEPAGR